MAGYVSTLYTHCAYLQRLLSSQIVRVPLRGEVFTMLLFVLLGCMAFAAAQNNTEPCELGIFMTNRAGRPPGAFGPVLPIDTDACYQNCVDTGCACTLEREGGCSMNAASDCDIQARCCYFNFWEGKTLNDINEEDPEGRTWGQYFCDVSYEAIGVAEDEIYALTMDMDGRWQHCGNSNLGQDWVVIDNGNMDVPEVVCCDQLHNYLDCE